MITQQLYETPKLTNIKEKMIITDEKYFSEDQQYFNIYPYKLFDYFIVTGYIFNDIDKFYIPNESLFDKLYYLFFTRPIIEPIIEPKININNHIILHYGHILIGFYAIEDIEFELFINNNTIKYKLKKGEFMHAFNNKMFISLCKSLFSVVGIIIDNNIISHVQFIYGTVKRNETIDSNIIKNNLKQCFYIDKENNMGLFLRYSLGLIQLCKFTNKFNNSREDNIRYIESYRCELPDILTDHFSLKGW